MIYPIYVYGSAVLRKESTEIDNTYPELKELIENMYETMYESDGVGLAAPQIGKNIRLFVVDGTGFAEEDPKTTNFKMTFINAHIYERFGEEEPFYEGCLSVPNIREDVVRKTLIKMRYMDENFVEHDEEFDGMRARIIQHEYDHIDAKLFIDHIAPIRKTLIKNKLAKIIKGDYKASYRTKLVK